jgi:hypothetical protein
MPRLASPRTVSPRLAGVRLSVKGPEEGEGVEWDADGSTLRLPYNVVEGSGERRTKLVVFTCNKCGE